MSILKVYLNWANSVLSEGGKYVDGVSAVQGGRVLCDLIDILTGGSTNLVENLQRSTPGNVTAQDWIERALEHMKTHGIKYTFTVQDILDGDIKSLLDILWLTILNYSLHNIEQNAYQRSVGIGKKYLMEWCEQELNTQFDSRNTFAFNLCQGDWFTKLLHKFIGGDFSQSQERVSVLNELLDKAEEKLSISRDIISASDIVDGTVDEHTLMIYVALLRRRVGGDNKLRAYSRLHKPPGGMNMDIAEVLKRSRSSSPSLRSKTPSEEEDRYSSDSELFRLDESRMRQNRQTFSNGHYMGRNKMSPLARKVGSSEDISDWVSSSSDRNCHQHSPNGERNLGSDGENLLKDTISQQVTTHMRLGNGPEQSSRSKEPVRNGKKLEKAPRSSSADKQTERAQLGGDVKIKRPKDYFLQWEDTLDRLSQGPSSVSDLMQSSRSQSDLDLDSLSGRSRSSSKSRSHELPYRLNDNRVLTSSLDREKGKSLLTSFREKSHSQPESMKKYSEDRSKRREDESQHQNIEAQISDLNLASLRGTKLQDLQSHPMFPNLKSLLAKLDPKELENLNKSGNPPDVLTLLETIKKARLAVGNNMPNGDYRSRRSHEETTLKSVVSPDRDAQARSASPRSSEDRMSSKRLRETSLSPSSRNIGSERRISPLLASSRRPPSYSPRNGSPRTTDSVYEDENDLEEYLSLGYSHLPRREAWERQRHKPEVTVDASKIDSLAQARFIEVLCKEIEDLKNRMDNMEGSDDSPPVSPTAGSRADRFPSQPTGTKIEPLSTFSDIHDQNGQLVFESSRSRSLSPIYTRQRRSPDVPRRIPDSGLNRQQSPDYSRSRSLSPTLERQRDMESRLRTQISPERYNEKEGYRPRSPVSYERYVRTMSISPVRGSQRFPADIAGDSDEVRAISLGYSSPVRSVTQEIWGNKLNTIKGLEPERQERWKNLIAMRELSDEDVIELKQALASCIVENDILQAKLRNAKADVTEKLFKTNDVLDDCRRHLAKSQAENMEYRTNLEHERQKAESFETQVKTLSDNLYQAKAEGEQMREELRQARDELNQAICDQEPIEDLQQLVQHLKLSLSTVETQNDSLQHELDDMHQQQEKGQTTIQELRQCLEEVRDERTQLFQEINSLHASNQKSRVADIIKHYSDKPGTGAAEDKYGVKATSSKSHTHTVASSKTETSPTRRSRSDDYISTKHESTSSRAHRRTSTWENELDSSSSKLNSSLNLSGTLGDTSSSRDTGYGTEDMTPTVPSSFREIYPHRKTQYYRRDNLDLRASPVPFADYSDLQQYPTKLSYTEYEPDEYGDGKHSLSYRNQETSRFKSTYMRELEKYDSSHNYSRDVVEAVVESPTYKRSFGDPLSRSLREEQLWSNRHTSPSDKRLNQSYDDTHSRSTATKKGILKNGLSSSRLRERSCSPVLQRYSRSHSPPTRLSSDTSGKPIYGRSSSARRVPRVDGPSELKAGYSRAKSWYELQLAENEKNVNRDRIAEITAKLSEEPSVLSDAQKRYADHLIEKYTGQRIPTMETY